MKCPNKLQFSNLDSLARTTHRLRHDDEEDNVGVESAEQILETATETGRLAKNSIRSRKLKNRGQSEPPSDRSRASQMQQERIKQQYAKEKRTAEHTSSFHTTPQRRKTWKDRKQQLVRSVRRSKYGLLAAVAVLLVVAFFLNTMSSCTALLEGTISGLAGMTYPSLDADMLAAEAAYAAMEAELQYELDHYEDLHPGSDLYSYSLDAIGHDPYVLISILTALHGGSWTIADVQDTLTMLFEQQCTLTEVITNNGEIIASTVKLENFDLSHLPVYIMTEEQVSAYAMYMASLGNRPDLFPQPQYPNASTELEYEDYDIPPEALEDDQFAAMIAEAEKYLGYPYVWGGSNPSTSFDCSGFVSWVINHSGWNVGRLSAQSLLNICTRVSSSNARPGDLIFFEKTYNTTGASHVGIYVGNNKMIHCGNPISYTSTNSSYWQEHFLAFGRLP